MGSDPSLVKRTKARSKRISYTSPITIRGGGRKTTHFDVLPSYVPHASGQDSLALKIRYWKTKAGTIRSGYPAEFTLDETEAIALRDVINRALEVTAVGEDGTFLLIPLDDASRTDLSGRDPTQVTRALALLLGSDDLRAVLQQNPEALRMLANIQGAVRATELEVAIAQLERHLASEEAGEPTYQSWCERYSWAFGSAYAMRDEVRTIALGDQVDLLMKQTANGLRDIIELKRPDKSVIRYDTVHRSFFWSSDVSMAIGQCHRYLDALHETAVGGLRDHPEVVAYHPKAVIVIGRSAGWSFDQLKALHGLNNRLHGLQVMTYDQLLAQAQCLLQVLKGEKRG